MTRKIAYVTDFFSDGMGYTENCLPPAPPKTGYLRQRAPYCWGQAVQRKTEAGEKIMGVFVGAGEETTVLARLASCRILSFAKHDSLAEIYRDADIAAWPAQESLSMLDAMASIVSDKAGDQDRVEVSGLTYEYGNIEFLMAALSILVSVEKRTAFGEREHAIAIGRYSWDAIARQRSHYYGGIPVQGRP